MGFILLTIYSLQFYSPNKYYFVQLLSSFDLGNNPGFPEGRIVGYGIHISSVMLLFSYLFMLREFRIKFSRIFIDKKKLLFLITPAFFFVFWGLVISFYYSPFTEFSIVRTLYYSSTYLVGFAILYYFNNYKNKINLLFVTIIFSIWLQFFLSGFQFILQREIGLAFEGGVPNMIAVGVDESNAILRPGGTFFHNQLGLVANVFMISVLPIVFSSLPGGLGYLTLLVGLITIILSQSRSAWITLLLITLFFYKFYSREITIFIREKLNKRFLYYAFFLAGLLFFIIFPRVLLTLNTGYQGAGLSYRKEVISEALEIFTKNPWFGFGAGINEYVLFQYFPSGSVKNFPAPVHEGHLEFLLEFGLIGFLLFYSPFYLVMRNIFTNSIVNKRFFRLNKDYIFRFLSGLVVFTIYYLLLPHGDIIEYQYLGLVLGYGLIVFTHRNVIDKKY